MTSPHFTHSSQASEDFSMLTFIDTCMERIKADDGIDIVLSTRDMADLVHAVLASKFEHILGPSYISSFVTLFKPYTKLLIDTHEEEEAIPFEVINVESATWSNVILNPPGTSSGAQSKDAAVSKLLQKVNGRGFMKPPAATCSSLAGDFNDSASFQSLLSMHKAHGKVFSHYLPAFVKTYLEEEEDVHQTAAVDSNKSNFLKQHVYKSSEICNLLLVEQFVDTPIKVTVDGCVCNKEIHVWAVIDSIYWSEIGRNECFVGCFAPSNLSSEVCEQVIDKYRRHVQRLITEYGFDNQFINVEFFVNPKCGGNVFHKCAQSVEAWRELKACDVVSTQLMEMNARAFMQMTPIYRKVFRGWSGDPIYTLLQMYDDANGTAPKVAAPQLLDNVCGLNGYLSTLASGIAEDLFDFDAAEKYIESELVILAVEKGQTVNTVGQQGSLLAYANVTGENYAECLAKMLKIGNELVKKGAVWKL